MFYSHLSHHGNVMTPLRFFFLLLYFSVPEFFFRNLLRDLISLFAASIRANLNNFYESVLEIFWNEVQSVTETVNNHTINIMGNI